jgi:two-component system cell cycle sensor histidine kinase/response regulator CckA
VERGGEAGEGAVGAEAGRELGADERERALSAAIVRGLPGVFYLFDEHGRFVRWNERFERVTGYSPAEIAAMHPIDFFVGDERALVAERIARVLAEGESDVEAELVSKRGVATPFFLTGVLVELAGVRYVAGSGVDLSARREAERALRRAVAWQRAILDSADMAIVSIGRDGLVQSFNPEAERLFGYAADEVVGKVTPEVFHVREELEAHALALGRARGAPVEPGLAALLSEVSGGSPVEREWTFVTKDQRRVPARLTTSELLDADGHLIGWLGVAVDLTERRREEARRRIQGAALAAAANAIVIADGEGRVEWVNPAYTALTGYGTSDAPPLGAPHDPEVEPARSPARDEALWSTITRGEVYRSEHVARRRDGSRYHEEQTITPVRDGDGVISHFVAIKQDVSARKHAELERARLEEQLRVSEKLRALGSLAGGIAHDFNNLLAVILTYAEVALGALPAGGRARADVGEIRVAALRAAELTKQLLAFGRRQVLRAEPLDLNDVVRGLETMLRRVLGGAIELELALSSTLDRTLGDPSQLEQLVVNLAVNARDAMPQGGRLTVESANVSLSPREAELRGVAAGDYVRLSVTDTGAGMDDATRTRAFEPFYTTKAERGGTGLGLAIVHGIVEQSGGHVTLESVLGAGTTVEVLLPRSSVEREPSHERERVERVTGGETVLVVDDEPSVRAVVERVLGLAGYSVLGAPDGEAALALAARTHDEIHLVLTDVAMPKIGGRRLVEQLLTTRPRLRVLYMSGYADDDAAREGQVALGAPVLAKPFGVDELLHRVREVLDLSSR